MGALARRLRKCRQRDIIRIPLQSEGALRVVGVCSACGAFKDVTGLSAPDTYRAVHESHLRE